MQRAFDPGQIARMLGVGTSVVSKWIDSGKLPGYRIPHSKRRKVRYEDLEAFCKKHELTHLFNPVRPAAKSLSKKTVLLVGMDPSMVKQLKPLLDEINVTGQVVADYFDVVSLAIHKKVIGVAVDFGIGRVKALDIGRKISQIRNETQRMALVYSDEDSIEPEHRANAVYSYVMTYPFSLPAMVEMLTITRRSAKYETSYRKLRTD